MRLIVCVDDNLGMAFNSRRVSQDSEVVRRIRNLSRKGILWVTGYSVRLFLGQDSSVYGQKQNSVHVCISDKPELSARTEDTCFLEDREPNTDIVIQKAQEIVLFRWNRAYPSDVKFRIPLDRYWKLKSSEDFQGSSHEKITEEVWGIRQIM